MKRFLAAAVLISCAAWPSISAMQPDGPTLAGLRWRSIGPNRPGRAWAVAGVPGDPSIYYMGTPSGAFWKSTNGGTTWKAMSDALPVNGFGAIGVSESNPNIVYIGSGLNTLGMGVYRSNDAGTTWQHVGLDDTKYITGLLVDPRNPEVVVAGAGGGGNFGSMVYYNNNPSPSRGVYRTTDGGRTWAHTLFVDAATPVIDLACDPSKPDLIYASLSNGIYRSADSGAHWVRLASNGAPAASANIAVARGSNGQRIYALVGGRSGGVYRSDDGGDSWTLTTSRTASAGGHLYVDPVNPDTVYLMGTSMYRSTDAGKTFAALKGAPGGDDLHALWIDPKNPRRLFAGADQGPTISLDHGESWTPWYTVPSGELYFVSTDNQFPYRVYAAQQDSGTVSILSRSDFGEIRPNDWYPVSGYEQGHIFDDPITPRYVYSHGEGHAIVRFDRVTGQSGPVYTPSSGDRFGPRPGMDLSRKDPHWMFVGAQYVLASSDRVTWTRISPDLTTRTDQPAPAPAAGRGGRDGGRGGGATIVAIAASPVDLDVIWAGTSNGLIHVTRDRGKTWTNVAPPRLLAEPALTLWTLEASPHDPAVAYAAAIDLSDRHGPCLLRTTDFGAHWTEIDDGLPANVPTRVVREDPQQPSLLYAGTHSGAFVSFDAGGHWRPLQLNLPRVTVNDITVHDNDLVIATWGRGLWILDDVSALRQWQVAQADRSPLFFFTPPTTTRVRWDNNKDTPLPPEVVSGENPPDGAILDYDVRAAGSKGTITIRDATGAVVRQFTSTAPTPDPRMPNVPEHWFGAPPVVATGAGMHRFVWDLRYDTPPSLDYAADGTPAYATSYGIIAPAIEGHSPRQQPLGPLVAPGTFQVTIDVDGHAVTHPLRVVNDPRSTASADDMAEQTRLEVSLLRTIERDHRAIEQLRGLHPAETRARDAAIGQLAAGRSLVQHLGALEFADLKPTASTLSAIGDACRAEQRAFASYQAAIAGAAVSPIDGIGCAR